MMDLVSGDGHVRSRGPVNTLEALPHKKERTPVQKIRPWLWFDTQAEEAAKFYVSVFKNSHITQVSRYGEAGPGPVGSVMVVSFELDGVEFMALNGGSNGDYQSAFYVDCETQEEIDDLWERLSEGGEKSVCGWLKDRYGVSWNLVPSVFGELMSDEDEEKTDRVMKAMLSMTKIDIAALLRAYEQA
jgi:predicted 3-demethylubiquinone-9 3-methyltransferase (glyoxalase superfamily)